MALRSVAVRGVQAAAEARAARGGSRTGVRALAAPAGGQATKEISEGDSLPEATLRYFDNDGNAQEVSTSAFTANKKVVLIGVPGAFTPVCSNQHLPGFREKAEELKSKGVSTIACISVNDSFVMREWKNAQSIGDEITMLADGAAEFTKKCGLEMDATDKGLGIRSRRYAMLVDSGVVKKLNLEEGGGLESSTAENMLAALE